MRPVTVDWPPEIQIKGEVVSSREMPVAPDRDFLTTPSGQVNTFFYRWRFVDGPLLEKNSVSGHCARE